MHGALSSGEVNPAAIRRLVSRVSRVQILEAPHSRGRALLGLSRCDKGRGRETSRACRVARHATLCQDGRMPDTLTTSEAARMLGCSPRTVQRMIEDDKLTPERKLPGPNGAYLIPLAEVERVLAERAA